MSKLLRPDALHEGKLVKTGYQTVFSRLCGAAVTMNSKCGMTEQLEFGLGEKSTPAKWPYPVCSYVTRHSEDELNSDAKDSPRRNGVR